MFRHAQPARPRHLCLPDGSPAAELWSLSPGVLHLNHGSFGAVPHAIQMHQNELRAQMDANPVAWFAGLPKAVGMARESLASLLGADPLSLAVVPNATAGTTAVFRSLCHEQGGDVLVTDHGYGAVTYGAERLARRWAGNLVTARVPLDATPAEAADAVIGEVTTRTKLIVVDHITSPTARVLPVEEISRRARDLGITTLVDGAHVPGLYNDWPSDEPWDYWVGNLHKFACAPRGTAVLLAGAGRRKDLFPVIDGWGTPLPYPSRFDWQGTLDLTSYLAAPGSWELIEQTFGWGVVQKYQQDLADYAERLLADAFAELTGEDHTVAVGQPVNAIRLIRLPGGLAATHAEADELRDRFVELCDAEAAFTSFAGVGYLRISTTAYTTAADFERFAEQYVPVLTRWAREAGSQGVMR